jgi:hypothetical protein
MSFVHRPELLSFAAGASLAVVVLFACSSEGEGAPPRSTQDGAVGPGDGAAPPQREAGVAAKCATYSGSTSSDACSCGETQSPYTGPPTDKCPIDDNPYYCVSYDALDPPPQHRECTCQPKCLHQRVGASSGGDAGGVDTCRCGVSSRLVLGGDGSRDEARPSCDGYAVCCRFSTGCDCTNDAAYQCPANSTTVASCTPDDFKTDQWKSLVYGGPGYSDLVDVPRCR